MAPSLPREVADAVEQAHRQEWAVVLSTVARLLGGDLDLAEECTQEAFVAALEQWADGVPARPGAWLTAVARRRAVDRVRREAGLRRRLPTLAEPDADPGADPADTVAEALAQEDDVIVDERLRLVFTCAHPALAPEARTALTLRMCCGLTTAEIARAFLVPEPTMAARLTRAKKKITAAAIPYRVPSGAELPDRLDGVLTVVHVVYTTGHAAAGGELVRRDLTDRALGLVRVLAALMPDEPEVAGLQALLELTDARSQARTDAAGRLVLLEDQDRTRWDPASTARGLAALDRGLALLGPQRRPGRFLLQGAIAGVHAEAPDVAATDWAAVLALYDRLREVWPSPVVDLNRAVALAYAAGPEAGLAALDEVASHPALARYPYLPVARAELLRRAGRGAEAVAAYDAALGLWPDGVERDHLRRRRAELAPDAAPGPG